ncbi:MAG: 30S ribosomal protein S3 [Ruminococcaceae bacterium]|nr:30S ribosomal protein S3 [Oscillospiraceae bacterium]
MGQKVNPHGLRVGVIKNWDSRWYASDEKFGDILVSDYNLRKHLKNKLLASGVSKIEIERDAANEMVKVFIHCAKPGMIIGKGGAEIENIRKDVEKLTGKKAAVNVVEVKHIDTDAQLVAESICSQLERRIGFRRAMKQAIGRTMKFAKGIKIACSGRLGGAEIARTEHYHEGTIPLQTLRADIDYGFWEANTTYGKIGVKVWIYKGEVLSEVSKTVEEKNDRPKRRFNNKDNKGDSRRRAPRAPKNTEGGAH